MEDKFLDGHRDGWKRGLREKDDPKKANHIIGDLENRAHGQFLRSKKEGDVEKAYYWFGYMNGLKSANGYIQVLRVFTS